MHKEINTSTIYTKDNSFLNLNCEKPEYYDIINLVRSLNKQLPYMDCDEAVIVVRAIKDLESKIDTKIKFDILPHVKEEIKSLNNKQLGKYIYYRYRYDIFPKTYELDEYPPVVQIEPTSICNYRCVFCFQTDKNLTNKKNGHMGQMGIELFQDIIDEINGKVHSVTMASRGEPLIHKNIGKMLMYMKNKFVAVKLNTNASLLNEDLCRDILDSDIHTLVFSADAAKDPLYSTMRVNGNLKQVLNNIKLFNKIKSTEYPRNKIITRVSGVKYNEQQNIKEMSDFWGDYVNQVTFVSYNPWENTYKRPVNTIDKACSDLWRRLFIWWDGKCNPCDVDYLSNLKIGQLPSESIKQIWTGEAYNTLRDMHFNQKRNKIFPCNRCTQI